MSSVHKVLIRHHHARDERYKLIFEQRFGAKVNVIDPWSVQLGDIDPNISAETIRQKSRDEYLRNSTVTLVLIGALTWQRKHIDWELGSSLRDTHATPRSGLLGIILPSYYEYYRRVERRKYNSRTIPPRLYDNVQAGFAKIHDWTDDPKVVQNVVHAAYVRRDRVLPNNSRPSFGKNRTGDEWED